MERSKIIRDWFINIIYVLLPMGIAFYIIYPLLAGDYLYPFAEYELYKSFMVNFIDTLRKGELPQWNEYVGSGHPALYFGHYPITQNTAFYMLFGFSDFTYYFTKFINLTILLLSFISACKYLKLSYLIALIGALTYFSVNFVTRFLMPLDTIGNILLLYPLLMILTVKIIDENKTKDILIFNLLYIFWLSGGNVTWLPMHLAMFFLFFWITLFAFYEFRAFKLVNLKKFIPLYFILFIIPFVAVLYQYYFIYDVVSASNRLKEGLIVSPFDLTVWKHFAASFNSSSYFWVGLILIIIYIIMKLLSSKYNFSEIEIKITPANLILLAGIMLYLAASNVQFNSKSNLVVDLIPILNSSVFRISMFCYFIIHLIFNKFRYYSFIRFDGVFIFIVIILLLSYYFHSPENIIGDVNGYDYELFRELSIVSQVIFTLSILISVREYQNKKIVKILVLSAIILYLIRSHLTIPIMRFTGIVWYATRDGSIFSFFFAVLFMFGLKNVVTDVSYLFKNRGSLSIKYIRYIQYGLLTCISVLLVHDSYNKFYRGTSHRYIYPNKQEIAKSPMEKWVLDGRKEIISLNNRLLALDKEAKHFYRIFYAENNYLYLTGHLQQHKIHEAVIYESSISRQLQDLYDYTILRKNISGSKELKDVMPYFLFTKHVHTGLGLKYRDIQYRDFFIFSPTKDVDYIKNQNVELLWDIMQVKYLLIGPEFSKAVEGFTNHKYYKLLGNYSKLNLNLYEVTKDKSYTKLAILPLVNQQDYDEVIKQLNSKDIEVLKTLCSKLVFLDHDTAYFRLLKNKSSNNKRYYEIDSGRNAILIDFESWNRNWGLKINDKNEKLQKAFQMFKGIRIEPGLNRIELTYELKYFKELFLLSIVIVLIYICLLGRCYYKERINKRRKGYDSNKA